jgi:nucleoside-diphosphate-sugar epimerase
VTIVDFSSSTVLVPGGAGFTGAHLVDALLSRGATVPVMDNFATGYRQNLGNFVGARALTEDWS